MEQDAEKPDDDELPTSAEHNNMFSFSYLTLVTIWHITMLH